MTTLISTQFPELAILDPVTGGWITFAGGKLVMEDGDVGYAAVMEEAARNPAIAVYQNVSTCIHCGDTTGSKAKLEAHVKDTHFDKWIADEDAKHAETRIDEIKARPTGIVCDACVPAQVFGSDEALAVHNQILHLAKPRLNDDGSGNPGGDTGGGGAEVTEIPAASGSQN